MAEMNIKVVPSFPYVKVQSIGGQNQNWTVTGGALATPPSGDGVFDLGFDGNFTANLLKVLPYGHMATGSLFSMRLWNWTQTGNDNAKSIWIGTLIAELACQVGEIPGVGSGSIFVSQRDMNDNQRFCDGLSLTTGVLGADGLLVVPGPGLVAWAKVETQGAQKLQFDFLVEDGTANAWWTRA